MNKIGVFLIFTVLTVSSLFGKIVETKSFRELFTHLKPDTLVILDIDDTLLVPVQTLGNDVWFQARHKQNKLTEPNAQIALDKAVAEWEAIRKITKVKMVECGSDEIVKSLQKKNIPVMALTTQGLTLSACTINQLSSLNFDLLHTAPSKGDHYFINSRGIMSVDSAGVLFTKGILFTSGTHKGMALSQFLNLIDYKPKHILFLNDKESHLREMEVSFEKSDIEFTGLRYSYSDERIANYRHDVAEVQLKHSTLIKILSDEEALAIIER